MNGALTHPSRSYGSYHESEVQRSKTSQVETSLSYRNHLLFVLIHGLYFPFALLISVNSSIASVGMDAIHFISAQRSMALLLLYLDVEIHWKRGVNLVTSSNCKIRGLLAINVPI